MVDPVAAVVHRIGGYGVSPRDSQHYGRAQHSKNETDGALRKQIKERTECGRGSLDRGRSGVILDHPDLVPDLSLGD